MDEFLFFISLFSLLGLILVRVYSERKERIKRHYQEQANKSRSDTQRAKYKLSPGQPKIYAGDL